MEHYPLFEHPPYSLALAVEIHRVAQREELDLVHVHYAIPHATSAWIAQEMLQEEGGHLPFVTTLHGTDITLMGIHPSFHRITRFSIDHSTGITAVSGFLADATARDFGVARDRIEVIPNFIDPNVYRPGKEPCHRATLAPDGEKIVMHVSNFRPVKRVQDVVATFAQIMKKLPSRLVFVGDGPERPRVQALAEEMGIGDHVVFLGKHASVDELLSCADLFLLPSESESFGLAALEAMACGTPVVASRVGGLPEVIGDGVGGYLCEVGDVQGMAEAGIRILSDDVLRQQLATDGRAHAIEAFAADRVVPKYEEYYRRILGGSV